MTKLFPEEVENEVLKLGCDIVNSPLTCETVREEEIFGIKWTRFEEQVMDVVNHYLEIRKRELEG